MRTAANWNFPAIQCKASWEIHKQQLCSSKTTGLSKIWPFDNWLPWMELRLDKSMSCVKHTHWDTWHFLMCELCSQRNRSQVAATRAGDASRKPTFDVYEGILLLLHSTANSFRLLGIYIYRLYIYIFLLLFFFHLLSWLVLPSKLKIQ